jgi:hypothetical protein
MNTEVNNEPQTESQDEQLNNQMEQMSVNQEEMDEEVVEHEVEEEDQDEDDEESEGGQSAGSSVNEMHNIDLSDNDFYKGLCTLLEDEQGNNILEYISLLHTELIGLNKNMRLVRKDIGRIATCAEIMVKSKM